MGSSPIFWGGGHFYGQGTNFGGGGGPRFGGYPKLGGGEPPHFGGGLVPPFNWAGGPHFGGQSPFWGCCLFWKGFPPPFKETAPIFGGGVGKILGFPHFEVERFILGGVLPIFNGYSLFWGGCSLISGGGRIGGVPWGEHPHFGGGTPIWGGEGGGSYLRSVRIQCRAPEKRRNLGRKRGGGGSGGDNPDIGGWAKGSPPIWGGGTHPGFRGGSPDWGRSWIRGGCADGGGGGAPRFWGLPDSGGGGGARVLGGPLGFEGEVSGFGEGPGF